MKSLLVVVAILCTYCPLVVSGQHVPHPKAWWGKYITADMYTAGRLTEAQLKYTAEAGFKSLISLFNSTEPSAIGGEYIPTSDEEEELVNTMTDMQFEQILQPGEAVERVETIETFTRAYLMVEKPVMFHCISAFTASYVGLLYHVNQTRYNPNHVPWMDSREFFVRAAALGMDYNREDLKQLLSEISGEPIIQDPPLPDADTPTWRSSYWLAKPIYKNWYVAGQIQENYLPDINSGPYDFIYNTRVEDASPMEEVNLLNIQSDTGPGRQDRERLESTRIDPEKPNEYIGINSTVNYQSSNELEWGDHIGYNEELENLAMRTNFSYHHTPIGGDYRYTREMFIHYLPTWREAGDNTTLIHSQVGIRAAVAGLLMVGYTEGFDSVWALRRGRELGYFFEEGGYHEIVDLFVDVLGEASGSATRADVSSVIPMVTILLLMTRIVKSM